GARQVVAKDRIISACFMDLAGRQNLHHAAALAAFGPLPEGIVPELEERPTVMATDDDRHNGPD
ncbi:MAG TPA: hypothetical protein VMR25_04360, partial [Planctomycetaceae bacterium]|nr:hypothetical protein [Planctomycetaceae bacterium]